ncbi:MAG: Uma2 family endonuclease [Pseudomonadota bacterium]
MALAVQNVRMTAEEFVLWHAQQDENYELVAGIPVKMMTGALNRHSRAASNIHISLARQLMDGPCEAFIADGAVRVNDDQVRYADVTVDCGPVDLDDYFLSDARLVVEILSPSTLRVDLFTKLAEYQNVSSIQYVLIVDAANLEAVLHARGESGWEARQFSHHSDVIDLPLLSAQIPLSEMFRNIAAVGTDIQ